MIESTLDRLRQNEDFMDQVALWRALPARPARTVPIPVSLDPRIRKGLLTGGIDTLYAHQAAAVRTVQQGENLVIATQTASGKSLCYTLPVLERLVQDPQARAIYLFPTKALAQDQLASTQAFIRQAEIDVQVATFDGDTPKGHRSKIRKESQLILTNPDMLHAGILPYHLNWHRFLSRLAYIVIDEIHTYRGVFGSHVANILRRLQRICAHYGATPQFICASATIANPAEHAHALTEQPFACIDESQNGAPRGEKAFIMVNPPLIDEALGLRRSSLLVAKEIASTFIMDEVQTAVFGRTRQSVELLLGYLQDDLAESDQNPAGIAGYRGGYLPNERREIEQALRHGQLKGVVATNALELGIDVGELDAAVLVGYPGSIASVWQQAGRAGRRTSRSAALMITTNSPLDQYIAQNPRYLFQTSPEHARINPNNLRILVKHLSCAAFEMPLRRGETFGGAGDIEDLLDIMEEMGLLYRTDDRFHYLGEEGDGRPPSHLVSLRTSGGETVVIQTMPDHLGEQGRVIGEIDLERGTSTVYEGAVYWHQADSYLVEHFDFENRVAWVRRLPVDYYTRASILSQITDLSAEATDDSDPDLLRAHGEVQVVTHADSYRKIRRYTHETLGFGEIQLPEQILDTTGTWWVFGERLTEQLMSEGVLLRPNDYGPNWQSQRKLALERDRYQCRSCGAKQGEVTLHVHHVRPFREYGYVRGENDYYLQANVVDNLVTLCPSCHRRAEGGQQARSALGGIAYALRNLAPLFLMCDPSDIEIAAERQHPLTGAPTIVMYERIPAGVGLAEQMYESHGDLLAAVGDRIARCQCQDGCPACVGPPGEIGPNTKAVTEKLIQYLVKNA